MSSLRSEATRSCQFHGNDFDLLKSNMAARWGVFVTCVGVDDFGAPHCLSCGEQLFGSSVLIPVPFLSPVVMLLLFRHFGTSMLFEVLRRKGWSPRVACGRLCIVGPATAGISRWRQFCCRCCCQGLPCFFCNEIP